MNSYNNKNHNNNINNNYNKSVSTQSGFDLIVISLVFLLFLLLLSQVKVMSTHSPRPYTVVWQYFKLN